MIQEPGRRPYKRANRTKNRPVLVAPTEPDAIVSSEQEDAASTSDSVVVEALPTITTTTEKTTTSPARRLSGFFSTVGKKQQTETTTDADIAQARIARATYGKVAGKAVSTTGSSKNEVKAVAKPEPKKATTTTKPVPRSGLFKTRYLIGMISYLLVANFVGGFETQAFVSLGIERPVTTFPLFGGIVQVTTSTLAYLATLVVLLIVLAYFDLIPRSFSAMTGQTPPAKRGTSSTKQSSSDSSVTKNGSLSMRQGVKGADDDLYEEYRYSQRHSKKK